jgi:hypothetical protein
MNKEFSADGVMIDQLRETARKNFEVMYDNAIQVNAWTCIDCVKPFLTTYREVNAAQSPEVKE